MAVELVELVGSPPHLENACRGYSKIGPYGTCPIGRVDHLTLIMVVHLLESSHAPLLRLSLSLKEDSSPLVPVWQALPLKPTSYPNCGACSAQTRSPYCCILLNAKQS